MSLRAKVFKRMAIAACAITLATTAYAGDKRFCGYVALGQGDPAKNIAAGFWVDKDDAGSCGDGVKEVKSELKSTGAWDAYDWDKKEYYKCESTKNWFEGINICNSCMDKKKKGYQTVQIAGTGAIYSCEKS